MTLGCSDRMEPATFGVTMEVHNNKSTAQLAAESAIRAIGRGYDLTIDLRLSYCKENCILIEQEGVAKQHVVLPGGVTVCDVSEAIKCDKGQCTRFGSGVLSFDAMSEHFNKELDLLGRIPSGVFNTMFDFSGSWLKDASDAKYLAYDGWFITLYSVGLTRSHIIGDAVKQEIPTTWDPPALAGFIEKYGTHVITRVEMGGKDVIYVKQQHTSNLQTTDVDKLLTRIADERFSDVNGSFSLDSAETSRRDKLADSLVNMNHLGMDSNGSASHSVKEDIIKIYKRRGGLDRAQSHNQWLRTIPSAPDVISMSFVPITSFLNGVAGCEFLSHAINLYLRYKPPIEELRQFLEFQLPRQWAPVLEPTLGTQRTEHGNTYLQFSLMGPKLYVNTSLVNVGKRPVTGVRLYLEGKNCNRLAIHLQHFSTTPNFLQLLGYDNGEPEESVHKYYEPVQWKTFSHVCTAPAECYGALIGDPEAAIIVTGAQLEVRFEKRKKILFLKLHFSRVLGASILKSLWDYSHNLSQKSGIISTLFSARFSSAREPPKPIAVNLNSALYPGGPRVPVQNPKLSKFVDTTELTKGPQDMPGHWVVTGAKLCVEGGKIYLGVKSSLLTMILDDSL